MTQTSNTTQRDELAKLISSRPTMAAADAILAAGYSKPRTITVDPAGREQLVNLLLTHRGTPRERLFEYPYRTDESWELIQQAEAAVTDVIEILNAQPEAEATR